QFRFQTEVPAQAAPGDARPRSCLNIPLIGAGTCRSITIIKLDERAVEEADNSRSRLARTSGASVNTSIAVSASEGSVGGYNKPIPDGVLQRISPRIS